MNANAKLRALAVRNSLLHSLLPDFDPHEFPDDGRLADAELIIAEMQANLAPWRNCCRPASTKNPVRGARTYVDDEIW